MTEIKINDARMVGIDREENDLLIVIPASPLHPITLTVRVIDGVSDVLPSLLTRLTNISKESI